MSVTWTPLHTSNDRDSRDYLRDARALLEEALAELDLATEKLSGADPGGDPVGQVRAGVADALRRCVELIEGSGA